MTLEMCRMEKKCEDAVVLGIVATWSISIASIAFVDGKIDWSTGTGP